MCRRARYVGIGPAAPRATNASASWEWAGRLLRAKAGMPLTVVGAGAARGALPKRRLSLCGARPADACCCTERPFRKAERALIPQVLPAKGVADDQSLEGRGDCCPLSLSTLRKERDPHATKKGFGRQRRKSPQLVPALLDAHHIAARCKGASDPD